jgi:hypothetical protein
MSVIPTLRRQRQEDLKFKDILDYIERHCLKTATKNRNKKYKTNDQTKKVMLTILEKK